jgi:hypothetical protein
MLTLLLNYAPRYVDVIGEWWHSSTDSYSGRLGGPQSRPGTSKKGNSKLKKNYRLWTYNP